MRPWFVLFVAVLCATAGADLLAEDFKSGLQPGEHAGYYEVKDITGPGQGNSLCYRCAFGERPVINIFVREITDDVARLVKQVDEVVERNRDQKLAAFLVVLTEDADRVAPQLQKLAKEHGIKNTPLTIFDGAAGPDRYKIAKEADLTVLMWHEHDVKVNFALKKGKLDGETRRKIVADTRKILK